MKDFHNVDLLGMKVKLIVNGQIHDTGVGANVLGNPWDSLQMEFLRALLDRI